MEIAIIPGPIMDRLTSDGGKRVHLNVLLSSLLALAYAWLTGSFAGGAGGVPHICLFRGMLGVPCPGCGVTASLRSALKLDFRAAVRYNPAGLAVLALLLAQVPLRVAALGDGDFGPPAAALSRKMSRQVTRCLLLVWAARLCGGGAGRRSGASLPL